MAIDLKLFNDPDQYVAIFDHNYKAIDTISDNRLIARLIKELSDISRIEQQICLLDLKSYLMTCLMYFPDQLRIKPKKIYFLRFIVSNFIKSLKIYKSKQVDVIIDSWSSGVLENFYGDELLGQLARSYKCLTCDLLKLKGIKLWYFLRSISSFVKCLFLAGQIAKTEKLDLREYVFVFFSAYLSGLTIRKHYQPKLVISGHHNGFSAIKAKAAGAEILMIPNGWYGLVGDTSFRYADYFIAIGGKYIIETLLKNGCVFKNVYRYGSLRLHNFNQQTNGDDFKVIYDILWGGYGTNIITHVDGYYPMDAEREAIRMFNQYVAKKGIKAAYHCRFDDDVERLKALGIYSEHVDYLPPTYSRKKPKNMYAAIKEAKVVMASSSSICHEALAMEKKIAFVNLSGNTYLNYPYRNAKVEYTLSSKVSFAEFVDDIMRREIDPGDYVVQNPNYVKDLMAIVDKVVSVSHKKRCQK